MPEGILSQSPVQVIRWLIVATNRLTNRLRNLDKVEDPTKFI